MSQTVINRAPRGSAATAPDRERRASAGGRLLRPLASLLRSFPTLLVLSMFGGLFYYGHHFDWKLPKFSTLAGAEVPKRADWCEEHGVPESQCVECNPDLVPKGPDYGWCPEHGVHNCVLHHPHVAQLKETPVVLESDLDRAARALALSARPENNAVCKVYRFPKGRRVALDLYGTNHDSRTWEEPEAFQPERFRRWDGCPFNFIPQGGGDHHLNHRCPGEWIAIELIKVASNFLASGIAYEVPEQDLRIDFARLPALPRSRFIIRNVRGQV